MLCDIANAAKELKPCEQRQSPHPDIQHGLVQPPQQGEQTEIGHNKGAFVLHQACDALPDGTFFSHACATLSDALFDAGLATQVTPDFASESSRGDGKGRRQHQIGVIVLLGVAMVCQVIGSVVVQVRTHRAACQPMPDSVVPCRVAHQHPVCGIVHQNTQAQLPTANQRTAHHPCQWIRPSGKHPHAQTHHHPSVQHQQQTHRVGAFAQALVFVCAQRAIFTALNVLFNHRISQGWRGVHGCDRGGQKPVLIWPMRWAMA